MAEYDVLTPADLNVDLILTNAVPVFGQQEKRIDRYYLELGGSCCIFACQAAKLGLKTAVVGVVGDDFFGDFVLKRLQECGVATGEVEKRAGLRTAASFILCQGEDRAILTDTQSLTVMPPERLSSALLAKTSHLHIGSYFLLSNLRPYFNKIAQIAKKMGITVSLDTNWDPDDTWEGVMELLPFCDIFFPNENEILAVTGAGNLEEAVGQVAEVVPLVVVKLGARGALARAGDRQWQVPSFTVKVVDSVGAGDSFAAGFLRGYLKGWPVEDALRLGCYCGAMNTSAPGGLKGQPTWEEVLHNFKPGGRRHLCIKKTGKPRPFLS